MIAPSWEDLPQDVHDAVERRFGMVRKAEGVPDSGPGVAVRLHTHDGTVFFKAIRTTRKPGAGEHLRARWAGENLPTDVPTPAMLWAATRAGWHAMAFEDLADDSRPADLSPGSADLPAVLDALALLHVLLTPCPPGAVPVERNILRLQAKWRQLYAKPPQMVPRRDLYMAAMASFTPTLLRGSTLVHGRLRQEKLRVCDGRVRVLDWSLAARGAPWVDAALFAPRLVQAGHTPAETDALLSTVVIGWRNAPAAAVAGLAALWTSFRLHNALHGPEEERDSRARAVEAGHAWLEYRMDPTRSP
ncbi:hypothetical protein [Nonomuraea sp. CA-141351]|uniref:hypothetical protein n=1 Tax=Nonomuraea sp. CA-141351 TaxID=3239996 RepID=UPI003D8AC358